MKRRPNSSLAHIHRLHQILGICLLTCAASAPAADPEPEVSLVTPAETTRVIVDPIDPILIPLPIDPPVIPDPIDPPVIPIDPIDPCIWNPCLCDPSLCHPNGLLPDLKINDVRVDWFGYERGCLVLIEVENAGRGAVTSQFDVDVFFGLNMAPVIENLSDYYVTYTAGPSSPIAPGQVVEVVLEIPHSLYGSELNVSALVDTTRYVEESNEGNNHWFKCSDQWLYCLY